MKILRITWARGGPQSAEKKPWAPMKGLGGRALTSAMISKEVPPLCHPLGEDNKLVIAPGLLSGTTAAMSGQDFRGLQESAHRRDQRGQCRRPAFADAGPPGVCGAIVLEGKPEGDNLYKIFINKDGVKISVTTA